MSDKSFGELLGVLIKAKRKAQGLTQTQLSEDAYETSSKVRRISEIENGLVSNPHPKTIDPIIVALKITDEELEACAKQSNFVPNQDLDKAYREARNLIDTLLYKFEHTNPNADMAEIDAFLKTKATEWRHLNDKISAIDDNNETLEELKTSAITALANGDFADADSYLLEAEGLQLQSKTLEEVSKLAQIRISRGDINLLRGEKTEATEKYIQAAGFFTPFDSEGGIILLDRLAHRVYEQSRRSTDNNFSVATELLHAAVEASAKRKEKDSIGRFKYKIAMMHRNQAIREPAPLANQLIDQGIAFSNEALEIQSPETDLNAWCSTKINLGNCFMEKGRRVEGDKRMENMEFAVEQFKAVLNSNNDEHELDDLLCHASNSLGSALMRMSKIDDGDRWDEALASFRASTEYCQLSDDEDAWAAANVNIGMLLAIKADYCGDRKKAKFLRLQSITAHLSGIEVYPSSYFPYQFAEAHYSLAAVLFKYGTFLANDLTESYLMRALMSYEVASNVFNKEEHPLRWAEMQFHMGMIFGVHAELEVGSSTEHDYDKSIEHIEKSINCFKALKAEDGSKRAEKLLREIKQRKAAFLEMESDKV